MVPEHLRPRLPSEETTSQFIELADEIEAGLEAGIDVESKIELWNETAQTPYSPYDFLSYHGAYSTKTFVLKMLLPRPPYLDANYQEFLSIIDTIIDNAEISEAVHDYYMELLEINFAGCRASELIYWPKDWFDNSLDEDPKFNSDQILMYLIRMSKRSINGSRKTVELPYPAPTWKPVIAL